MDVRDNAVVELDRRFVWNCCDIGQVDMASSNTVANQKREWYASMIAEIRAKFEAGQRSTEGVCRI